MQKLREYCIKKKKKNQAFYSNSCKIVESYKIREKYCGKIYIIRDFKAEITMLQYIRTCENTNILNNKHQSFFN
jgi:hypothetical protein